MRHRPYGCSSDSPRRSQAAPRASRRRRARPAARARRGSELIGVNGAGHRRPGAAAHDLPDQFIGAQRVDDRLRLGVEVEEPPERCHRRVEIAGAVSQNFASTCRPRRFRARQRRSSRQADAAEIDVAVDHLDAGHGAGTKNWMSPATSHGARYGSQSRSRGSRSSRKIRINSSRSSPEASLIAPG